MADTTNFIQLFVKLLDNKILTLRFPSNQQTPESIKHQIETLTQIPSHLQTLTLNGKLLSNINSTIKIPNFSTLTLNLSLLGGKGGFGSLLRGAATKAGQKKTNNFDACRDMSGRRLRHVNAEKKLEEWRADEEERKLEQVAEKFLKDMVKKGKGGKKEQGAEKYVEKYRQESARCVEDVEKSVREAMAATNGGKKRKVVLEKGNKSVDAKKLKIWMGKRKMEESDSDSDSEAESDESNVENEKSIVIDNGSQSDSSKDASSDSISVPQLDGDRHGVGSSDSGSEEEKETVTGGSAGSDAAPIGSNGQFDGDGTVELAPEIEEKTVEKPSVSAEVGSTSNEIVTEQLLSTSTLIDELDGTQLTTSFPEVEKDSDCKPASPDEGIAGGSNVLQPLIFDDYNSATEMEVLGMERLKYELQARGLKCGGTLQERAARLFLLKTTPLDKLPKKLLAKK